MTLSDLQAMHGRGVKKGWVVAQLHIHAILTKGVVYTMDKEVIPRPCRYCDWLLNSSWDHFHLHRGKNVKVIMEFEVPNEHSLRPTLPTDMVQRDLR